MELPAQRIDKVKRMNGNNNIHTKSPTHQSRYGDGAKCEKGFVLVLTVFTAVILATLIIGFLNMTAIDLNLVKNHMCSLQAYYIAEAGVADAIDKIQRDVLTQTKWESEFPSGTSNKYEVVVTVGSTTAINSTGTVTGANFSRELEVNVRRTGSSVPYKVRINKWKEK